MRTCSIEPMQNCCCYDNNCGKNSKNFKCVLLIKYVFNFLKLFRYKQVSHMQRFQHFDMVCKCSQSGILLRFFYLVNPFPNKSVYLCVCSISLSKTLRVSQSKEKSLVISNLSFSHSVFKPF